MSPKLGNLWFLSIFFFLIGCNLIHNVNCDLDDIIPQLSVDNPVGRFSEVLCRGQNLTSFSIFPCTSPQKCERIRECLKKKEGMGCQDRVTVHRGELCSSGDDSVVTCAQFRLVHFGHKAAILKCTYFSSKEQKEAVAVEYILQNPDGDWKTKINATLLSFEVSDHKWVTEHQERKTFFVGQEIEVRCRAVPFYFKNRINIIGHFSNGTKSLIKHVVPDVDTESRTNLDVEVEDFKILSDMVGFSCSAPWYNSTDSDDNSFEQTYHFDVQEASPPIFELREERRTFLNCDHFQILAFNFTGGPVDTVKCSFEPRHHSQNSQILDGQTAGVTKEIFADRHAYGPVGSLWLLVQDYEPRGGGVYSCQVENWLGNDTAHIFVENREIYGSPEAIRALATQNGEEKKKSGGCGNHNNGTLVMDPKTGKCYPIGPDQGPCGPTMSFNMLSLLDNAELVGKCGCTNLKNGTCVRTALWPMDGQCYELSSEGPCGSGNYFTNGGDQNGEPNCKPNRRRLIHPEIHDGMGILAGEWECSEEFSVDPFGGCFETVEI